MDLNITSIWLQLNLQPSWKLHFILWFQCRHSKEYGFPIWPSKRHKSAWTRTFMEFCTGNLQNAGLKVHRYWFYEVRGIPVKASSLMASISAFDLWSRFLSPATRRPSTKGWLLVSIRWSCSRLQRTLLMAIMKAKLSEIQSPKGKGWFQLPTSLGYHQSCSARILLHQHIIHYPV